MSVSGNMTPSGAGKTTKPLALLRAGVASVSVTVAEVTVQGAEETAVEDNGGDGDTDTAAGGGLRSSSRYWSIIQAKSESRPPY